MELAILVPILFLMMFGVYQLARVFYTYHTLQKAFRGGAGILARTSNVNYCDPGDPAMLSTQNIVVFGNPQGQGDPVVQGLTVDMVQITPERVTSGATVQCDCGSGNADSCDITSGGRAPDFVVVNNIGGTTPLGFPLSVLFPYVNLGTINLRVSVRMAVTGG